MFAGLILGVVRAIKGPGRVRWTLLLVFPFVYFYMVSGRSLIYGRYLLPMLPFVCLLAAIAVVSGVSLLRRFDIPRTPRRLLIAGDDRGAAAAAGQLDRVRSRHQRHEHPAGGLPLDPPERSAGLAHRDREARHQDSRMRR